MKRRKKTKVPQQRTELDQIVTQLRTILYRQTTDVVLAGNLLIKSRELLADEHGQWMPWLAENFDLSYRTAVTYCKAAEYAAKQEQICNDVSHLKNIAPTVLYRLAERNYTERGEAEILAQAKAGKRVDQTRAWEIQLKLAPPPDVDDDKDDDDDDVTEDNEAAAAEEDPEIKAILDGPPADVPPSALSIAAAPDFALRAFDQAVTTLKQLRTKPLAQFANTLHSATDLEDVESFIRDVMKAKAPR